MFQRLVTKRVVALGQFILSILFVGGYFWVLILFLFGKIKVPGEWHDAMQVLLGVMSREVSTVMGFWFSRSRPEDKQGVVEQ